MTIYKKAVIGLAILIILSMVVMTISIIFVPGTKNGIMSFLGQKKDWSKNSPNLWRFEEMKPEDLKKAIDTIPVAWIVFDPLKWNGDSMTYSGTTLVDQTVCEKAWEKVGGVLIPPHYIGAETNYLTFDEGLGPRDQWGLEVLTKESVLGQQFVKPLTLELVLRDYLFWLERSGFKLCVFVSSHESFEHRKVINDVCNAANAAYDRKEGKIRACFNYGMDAELQTDEDLSFKGSKERADFAQASRLGAIYPDMVDKSKFGTTQRDKNIGALQSNASKIDFEKGAKANALASEKLAKGVTALLKKMGWNP